MWVQEGRRAKTAVRIQKVTPRETKKFFLIAMIKCIKNKNPA